MASNSSFNNEIFKTIKQLKQEIECRDALLVDIVKILQNENPDLIIKHQETILKIQGLDNEN